MNGVTLHVDSRAHAKTHVGTSPAEYTVRLSEPIRDTVGVELVGSSVPTVTEVTLRVENTTALHVDLAVHATLHVAFVDPNRTDVTFSGTVVGITKWNKTNFFANVKLLVPGELSYGLKGIGPEYATTTLDVGAQSITLSALKVVHVNPVEACVQIDGVGDGLPSALMFRDPAPFARELTYAADAACMEGGTCYVAQEATPFPADIATVGSYTQPGTRGTLIRMVVTGPVVVNDNIDIQLPGLTAVTVAVTTAQDTAAKVATAIAAETFTGWSAAACEETVFFYNSGSTDVTTAHRFDANFTEVTIASGFVQRTVEVTTGSSTTGNLTVTLAGVASTVTVAAGDTAASVARTISGGTYTGWTTTVKDTVVTFTNTGSEVAAGAYSVAGQGVVATVAVPGPAFWKRSVAADGRLYAPQTQDVANSADTMAVLPMDALAAANQVVFESEPRTWQRLKVAIYRADTAEPYPFPYRNTGADNDANKRLVYQPHTLRLRLHTLKEPREHDTYRRTGRVNVGPKATAYGLSGAHPEHMLRGGDYIASQHQRTTPHTAPRHADARHHHA